MLPSPTSPYAVWSVRIAEYLPEDVQIGAQLFGPTSLWQLIITSDNTRLCQLSDWAETRRARARATASYCAVTPNRSGLGRALGGVRFAATRVVRGRLVTALVDSSDKPLPNPPGFRVLLVVLLRQSAPWQWIQHRTPRPADPLIQSS